MKRIACGFLALIFVSVFSTKAYCGFLGDLKSSASQVVKDTVTQGTSDQGSNQDDRNTAKENKIQNETVPDNQNKTINAQYSDFKWGMTVSEAKVLILSKGKLPKSAEFNEVGELVNPEVQEVISFNDNFFDTLTEINLCFTPKSKKLYQIVIRSLPNAVKDVVVLALKNKYGESLNGVWGKNEIVLGGGSFDFSVYYKNPDFIVLRQKEEKEIRNTLQNKIQNEAATKF